MLRKVTVYPERSFDDPLVLNLGPDILTDLIQAEDIDGLDPLKADINTTPFGSMPGGFYTGSNVDIRNIVFTLGFNPDWDTWTIAKLRDLCNLYFMSNSFIRMVFESDEKPPVEISGYVESNGQTIFSKDPESTVSVICPDPNFVTVESFLITDFATNSAKRVVYNGTVDTGFLFKFEKVSGATPTLLGLDVVNPDHHIIEVNAGVDATKYMLLSSVDGDKYIKNVDTATLVETSVLNTLVDQSKWPKLRYGDNIFYMLANPEAGVQKGTLTYKEIYGGL